GVTEERRMSDECAPPTNWSLERHGSLAVARFTRPPRNFMSFAAMSELEALTLEVAADDGVNVLMLTGGVDGYFGAHADLDDIGAIGRGETGGWDEKADPLSWTRTLALFESMPQPVVAAVNRRGVAAARSAWLARCASRRPRRTSASPRSTSASSPA